MKIRLTFGFFVSKSFYAFVLSGFLLQLHSIASHYLEYDTNSEVRMEIPQLIHPPFVSMCFKYEDISTTQTVRGDIFENRLSVNNIFKSVPSAESVITGCILRAFDSYSHEKYDSALLCNKYIEVDLFLVGNKVCYRFKHVEYIQRWAYAYDKLAYAIVYSSTIFSLTLSKDLYSNATMVKPIIHTDFPYLSYALAPITDHTPGRYGLYYMNISVHRLEYPYKTNCIQSSPRVECLRKCITRNTEKHFQKLPFDIILLETSAKQILDIQDTRNITKLSLITDKLSVISRACAIMKYVSDLIALIRIP